MQHKIDLAKERLSVLQEQSTKEQPNNDERLKLQRERDSLRYQLIIFESNLLTRKALRLGIEIPKNPEWWDNDFENGMPPEAVTRWLNYKGRIGAAKLIREERRKNIEWWAKIIIPFIAAITGIIGAITGLVAVSSR